MTTNLLVLMQEIKNYQPISSNVLNDYISNEQFVPHFLLIPNLFFLCQIRINSYTTLKNYIASVTNYYFVHNSYTELEKQWYNFYVLLKACRMSESYAENIIQDYNSLSALNTDKEHMQWIVYQVKTTMLSYLLTDENVDTLIEELENIPQSIKDLHY